MILSEKNKSFLSALFKNLGAKNKYVKSISASKKFK